MRFVCTVLVLHLLWSATHGQQADDLERYLPDTLNVYTDDNGDPYFLHRTAFSTDLRKIAHVFMCPFLSLQKANPQFSQTAVAEGDIIVIPLDRSILSTSQDDGTSAVPVMYWIQPGETLFRIARRYFDVPVETLVRLNKLQSTNITAGRKILVGWLDTGTRRIYDHVSRIETSEYAPSIGPFYGDSPVFKAGIAYWNKQSEDTGHLFAMHRTARINSLIEITNPMFNSHVLVKVVGRIPDTYRNDVEVVISPGVARALGAIDSRFRAELRYVD